MPPLPPFFFSIPISRDAGRETFSFSLAPTGGSPFAALPLTVPARKRLGLSETVSSGAPFGGCATAGTVTVEVALRVGLPGAVAVTVTG